MKNRELYQQKVQAQLDEWRADFDKFKAKASDASADSQLDINRNLKSLEAKIEEGRKKLSEISDFGEETWDSASENVRSGWESVKSGANDAIARLKR
ncbi:hypothetical protein [Marinobacter sp.]|uniref:hypothetical protein n=1 Tax=Marinobacter sp. TaxID=50741 RepID=UPI00384F2439